MILEDYLLHHFSFTDGTMNSDMFAALRAIAMKLYGVPTDNAVEYRIVVNEQCARRAYTITLANIEQYKLLMHITNEDEHNWSMYKCTRTKASPNISGISVNLQHTLPMTTSGIAKLKTKANKLKVKILLHDSILFIKSGLYIDRELKNASSMLENILLRELVADGLLHEVKRGLVGKFNKPSIYIKGLPATEEELPEFVRRLSEFDDSRLSFDNYISKCKKIDIRGKGIVSQSVFSILERDQYKSLDVDYSCLHRLEHG